MNVFYAIIIFVILLIFFVPIPINVLLNIKLLILSGKLEIRILKHKIFDANVKIKKGNIYINRRKRQNKIVISNKNKSFVYLKKLISMIYFRQQYIYLKINSTLGYKDDAFKAAMIAGSFDCVMTYLVCKLKNNKQSANIMRNTETKYDRDVFTVKMDTMFSISMFDILFTLVLTKLRVVGELNEKKHRKNTILAKDRVAH